MNLRSPILAMLTDGRADGRGRLHHPPLNEQIERRQPPEGRVREIDFGHLASIPPQW